MSPQEIRNLSQSSKGITPQAEYLRLPDHFFAEPPCGTAGLMQRMACGWQAKPMLEQTGGSPSAPREQFTH